MAKSDKSLHPATERINNRSEGIDTRPPNEILQILWEDQLDGVNAVQKAIPALETAAQATVNRLKHESSRLIYVGAGTSGVVAGLDGIELPCTYGWPDERLIVHRADDDDNKLVIDTAGDDGIDAARKAFRETRVTEKDVIVAVSASGNTRYTSLFARQSKEAGALVIGLANNQGSELLELADHPVLLDTGPEIIAGSTRMKAGTAQKTALNMFSTLTMTLLGHVYDGMMVSVQPGNDKLKQRASRMVADIAEVDESISKKALAEGGDVKTGVLIAKGLTPSRAREVLDETAGDLRRALNLIAER